MDDDLERFIEEIKREHEELVFFASQGIGAETHWFLTQAYKALKQNLYLPACSSFINGIEASLRVRLALATGDSRTLDVDPAKTLSNSLLSDARAIGLPIEKLAFPDEGDFEDKLLTRKPRKVNVEIVRVRHNLCHGNILEYVNPELGEDNSFFMPECCRDLANALYLVSKNWAQGLGQFIRTSA